LLVHEVELTNATDLSGLTTLIAVAERRSFTAAAAESRVTDHLAAKQLVRVLEAWSPPFPGLFLYYPSRANVAPKLRALVDLLQPGPKRRSRS
jgi:DNA-binding transcriptional LysR family regulator